MNVPNSILLRAHPSLMEITVPGGAGGGGGAATSILGPIGIGAPVALASIGTGQFAPKPKPQGPMDFDQIAEQCRLAAEGR